MQYEENQDRLKVCALCMNRIKKDHVVCEEHISDMELYRNTQWFIELCQMQERQYQIDLEEFTLARGGKLPSLAEKGSKSRSKQLTYTQKREIERLYGEGIGDRKIAKLIKINYNTVRNYLYRFRKLNKIATHFSN